MSKLKIEIINPLKRIDRVKDLLLQLNPDKEEDYILKLLKQMVEYDNYKCFGLFNNNHLIGISSGWTTVRIYSEKQLELDNVIIDNQMQSKGFGKLFFDLIEAWALKNDYKAVELNTYVINFRSHKFYYNNGYNITGYHFRKKIVHHQ